MNIIPITSLILANLVPLIGVVFFGWSISNIIFLYWFENIVIGIYTVAKMALAKLPATSYGNVAGKQVLADKKFTIPFFIFHFGMFAVGHGIFVSILFIKNFTEVPVLIIAIASLIISHGISFVTNYIVNKEYARSAPDKLMTAPYKRIVVMHLTIIIAGMTTEFFGQNMAALMALVFLKTLTDIAAHMFEHTSANTYVLKPNAFTTKLVKSLTPGFEQQIRDALEASIKSETLKQTNKDLGPEVIKENEKF